MATLRVADDRPDPASAHAQRDAIRRAVRHLPPVDRELLLLTVWEELSVAEAAAVVGCSVAAAHVRLHRARRRLRRLLAAPSPTAHREADAIPRPNEEVVP